LITRTLGFRLLLLASFFSPSSLLAADATIYTGIQNPGNLTVGNVLQDTNLGAVVGARISVGKLIGFEQNFGYSPNFLEAGDHAFNTQSNLVLGFPFGHITPYGTVGAGLIVTGGKTLYDVDNLGVKFTVNYGGGIKFYNLAGPLGFRVDVRGYSVPNVFHQTLNFIEATVGIMLSW